MKEFNRPSPEASFETKEKPEKRIAKAAVSIAALAGAIEILAAM